LVLDQGNLAKSTAIVRRPAKPFPNSDVFDPAALEKGAPSKEEPNRHVARRTCESPGAAGMKPGELSELPQPEAERPMDSRHTTTVRPAKEKKGTASRKVSGSGRGQTSEGKNPKDAAGMEQAWQVRGRRRGRPQRILEVRETARKEHQRNLDVLQVRNDG